MFITIDMHLLARIGRNPTSIIPLRIAVSISFVFRMFQKFIGSKQFYEFAKCNLNMAGVVSGINQYLYNLNKKY